MFKLLLAACATACMQDSQCNSVKEDEVTIEANCCYMFSCLSWDTVECQAGRYEAFEILREVVTSYRESEVITTKIETCDEDDPECGDILLHLWDSFQDDLLKEQQGTTQSLVQISRSVAQSTPWSALGYLGIVSMAGVAYVTTLESFKHSGSE